MEVGFISITLGRASVCSCETFQQAEIAGDCSCKFLIMGCLWNWGPTWMWVFGRGDICAIMGIKWSGRLGCYIVKSIRDIQHNDRNNISEDIMFMRKVFCRDSIVARNYSDKYILPDLVLLQANEFEDTKVHCNPLWCWCHSTTKFLK